MATAVQVQYRRGASSQVASFTGAAGELVVDTTNNRVVVQDGTTAGGWPMAAASRVAVSDANYTLSLPYSIVAYTAITAARAVSLSAAANYASGQRLLVIDESGFCSSTKTITLLRNGSDTIDGASSAVISQPYGYIELESNSGGKWTISDQGPQVNALNGLTGQLTLAATDGLAISISGNNVLVGGPGGMVNKFRNGAMDVWQRGSSPSMTAGTSGSQYTADGWIVNWTASSSAAPTISQGSGRLLSKNSLQVSGASNVTDVQVQQRIESLIAAAFCNQTVTVQAQIYNNTGGSLTPTLTVKRPSTQDGWSGTINTDINAVSLQTCAASAWTQVSYSFSANAASYDGLQIIFDFGNNFSANTKAVQITECDVRVTPGVSTGLNSSPPPPELRPIASELAVCQRYYYRRSSVGAGDVICIMQAFSTTGVFGKFVDLPVQMRAQPTMSLSSISHFTPYGASGSLTTAFSSYSGLSASFNSLAVTGYLNGSTGLVAGNAAMLTFNTASGWIDGSAEL